MEVRSQALSSIDYDDRDDRLEVAFRSGGRYAYFGVPAREYRSFVEADSKGRYFQAHILDRYPFARLN
jgi:lysyl-tRNA synthetase class 2